MLQKDFNIVLFSGYGIQSKVTKYLYYSSRVSLNDGATVKSNY